LPSPCHVTDMQTIWYPGSSALVKVKHFPIW
jgi:hypothetical protein